MLDSNVFRLVFLHFHFPLVVSVFLACSGVSFVLVSYLAGSSNSADMASWVQVISIMEKVMSDSFHSSVWGLG